MKKKIKQNAAGFFKICLSHCFPNPSMYPSLKFCHVSPFPYFYFLFFIFFVVVNFLLGTVQGVVVSKSNKQIYGKYTVVIKD